MTFSNLRIHESYRPPYLVQRIMKLRCDGKITKELAEKFQAGIDRSPEEKQAINDLMPLDYMGSSEFEFGAFGEAMRGVSNRKNDFVRFDTTLVGTPDNTWRKEFKVSESSKKIYGFCRRDQVDQVLRDVRLMATNQFTSRMKERHELNEGLFGRVHATNYVGGKRLRKEIITLEKSDVTAWFDIENLWVIGVDQQQIRDMALLFGVPEVYSTAGLAPDVIAMMERPGAPKYS